MTLPLWTKLNFPKFYFPDLISIILLVELLAQEVHNIRSMKTTKLFPISTAVSILAGFSRPAS